MLQVTAAIAIEESELEESFVRSSGPGGQNVNKVATAVQLRFDVRHSRSLPADVRARLMEIAANRINSRGVLQIEARRHRTQEQNREDARHRLAALVLKAATPPKRRRPTRVSKAAKERRLESKRIRSETKRTRGSRSHPRDES